VVFFFGTGEALSFALLAVFYFFLEMGFVFIAFIVF